MGGFKGRLSVVLGHLESKNSNLTFIKSRLKLRKKRAMFKPEYRGV